MKENDRHTDRVCTILLLVMLLGLLLMSCGTTKKVQGGVSSAVVETVAVEKAQDSVLIVSDVKAEAVAEKVQVLASADNETAVEECVKAVEEWVDSSGVKHSWSIERKVAKNMKAAVVRETVQEKDSVSDRHQLALERVLSMINAVSANSTAKVEEMEEIHEQRNAWDWVLFLVGVIAVGTVAVMIKRY